MNINRVYAAFFKGFRAKRMALVSSLFDLGPGKRVLDVGGTTYNWRMIDHQADVTLLNMKAPDNPPDDLDTFTLVVGDACDMTFQDDAFDLVFSNSTIEHVNTLERQIRFAHQIRRVGRNVFVQAPAWEFPVEPHYLTPLVHYLPKRVQKAIMRNFSVWGLLTRPSQSYVDRMVDEIRLPTRKEMQRLFPDCEIRVERVLGLPKSYIAVRTD